MVESTYNWYWLVDGLMAAGFPVCLAHLLRLGISPSGYIYPREERGLRDLLRRRLLLVRQRSLHHLSLQSLIARHSGQRLSASEIKQLETRQLADYLESPILLGGQITHQACCWLDKAIRRIEQELQRQIQPRDAPAA